MFLFTFSNLCPLLGCSQLGNGRPELWLCYQSSLRLWGLNCISFPSAEGSNPLSSNQLRKKPCKYFEQGKGTCPFGGKCLYLHAYPDGTRAEPEKPRKQLSSEGTVRVRSVQHLISGSPVLLGSVSCHAGQVKKSLSQCSFRQRFVLGDRRCLSFNCKMSLLCFCNQSFHGKPFLTAILPLKLSPRVPKAPLLCWH